MKGDHALALTAYVVLSVAVVGVSVDQFETNQATTPSSAAGAATPEGAAAGGPRVAPGGDDSVPAHEADGQPGSPAAGTVTAEEAVTTEASAPGAVAPGAQPRPPAEVPDSTSTAPEPLPETSTSEPGDTGSTMPCPGDDSVLVTPVPSGDLCPTTEPVPTEDDPGLSLEDLDPLGELDLPGLDFGSPAEADPAG